MLTLPPRQRWMKFLEVFFHRLMHSLQKFGKIILNFTCVAERRQRGTFKEIFRCTLQKKSLHILCNMQNFWESSVITFCIVFRKSHYTFILIVLQVFPCRIKKSDARHSILHAIKNRAGVIIYPFHGILIMTSRNFQVTNSLLVLKIKNTAFQKVSWSSFLNAPKYWQKIGHICLKTNIPFEKSPHSAF